MKKEHLQALALTLLVYALTLAAIHPFANVFYGGDDWSYAWSAKLLQEQHRLQASEFVAAAAVPQLFWAAAFVSLFGPSPWVFNLATLSFSVGGVALLYFIGIELGLRPRNASVLSLVVAIGPLYLGFAGSFMSDMYYLVLLLASALAYLRALRRRSAALAVLGGTLASLAFLNRQIGILLPAAFLGAVLVSWYIGEQKRVHALTAAGAGLVLPALTAATYRHFPNAFGGVTVTQRIKLSPERMWERMTQVSVTVEHAYLSMVYVSVLLLPLVIAWAMGSRLRPILASKSWRVSFIVLLTASLALFFWQLSTGASFLVRGEFFHTETHGAAPLERMGVIWKCLVFAGSAAFPLVVVLLCERLLALVQRTRHSLDPDGGAPAAERLPELVFLLLCFLGHLALVATFIAFYNNYLLPVVTLGAAIAALLLASPETPPATRAMRWLPIGVLALVSLGSILTLDSHTRFVEADARLADALVASGLKPREVFGYPSWYAWHNNDLVIDEVRRNPFGSIERAGKKAHYRLLDAERKPLGRGWRFVRTETYRTLLGGHGISIWRR